MLAFLAFVVGQAALGLLWPRWWPWAGVTTLALVVAAGLAAVLHETGYPKPYWVAWEDLAGAEVVAQDQRPGEAIYVWVRADGAAPRAYRLPWDPETATQVADALREAGERGGSPTIGSARRRVEGGLNLEMELPPEPAEVPTKRRWYNRDRAPAEGRGPAAQDGPRPQGGG